MMFKHWMTGEQNFGRMCILREDDIKQTIQMDDKINENEGSHVGYNITLKHIPYALTHVIYSVY